MEQLLLSISTPDSKTPYDHPVIRDPPPRNV